MNEHTHKIMNKQQQQQIVTRIGFYEKRFMHRRKVKYKEVHYLIFREHDFDNILRLIFYASALSIK